jgi:hypothetical protein
MNEIKALTAIAFGTFVKKDISSAEPSPYFAKPPYTAFAMNDKEPNGLHGIYNAQGINCLRFKDKPGAICTTKENAIALAESWNGLATPKKEAPQRPWVGLTGDEREQHRNDWRSNIHDKEFQAIEAKLKEKNA